MKPRSITTFLTISVLGFSILVLTQGCKKKPDISTLSTTSVTGITITSAVSGGNITSDGGAEVTARGICWGTSRNPLVTGSHTSDGTGTGVFASTIEGLSPNTLYYVRAYGTNTAGTGYGNEVSFTTSPLELANISTTVAASITPTTAVSGGSITNDGGAAITSRGVCWNTSANPSISDSKTVDGSGTGVFTSNLTDLQPGTLYHIRAYAVNSVGTSYGNEVSFTTNSIQPATVSTTDASSITSVSAVSGGNITNDGGANITARGICWSTSINPTVSGSKTSDGTGAGIFTSTLTGLQPGTVYHIRAYATNSAGTSYGNDLTFPTASVAPTVTTSITTGINRTFATSGGNVTASGGSNVTTRGVCWKTSNNPTTSDAHTSDGTGTGIFVSNITGLTPNTTYYVRAYAINNIGISYGNEVSFVSSPIELPTLSTLTPSSVTTGGAVSGGNITSDGGDNVTARGVCWSATQNPTVGDQHTSNGTGTGNFSSNITGLTAETQYFVRAYATNSVGTAYGSQVSFSTSLADIEGNVYRTVVIGTQIWMAENLRTVTFSDNIPIENITDNAQWSTYTNPAYCWYNNEVTYKPVYGALYNWYAVLTGKLCPTGWHVPSDDEFKTLEHYLGMATDQLDVWGWRGTDEGSKLKNSTGWDPINNGTNSSGFSARPGGYRFGANGSFNNLTDITYWWTSTENDAERSWYRRLDGINTNIYRASTSKTGGKYVRCVKN